MDALGTPAKGHEKRTMADAPFGARRPRRCVLIRVWRFSQKQQLDAHASFMMSPEDESRWQQIIPVQSLLMYSENLFDKKMP